LSGNSNIIKRQNLKIAQERTSFWRAGGVRAEGAESGANAPQKKNFKK